MNISKETLNNLEKYCELSSQPYKKFILKQYDKYILICCKHKVINSFYSEKSIIEFLDNYNLDVI